MSLPPPAPAAHPVISVLLPVYNAARWLPLALESISAQTFADFELIAVDDGSTDASLDVLRRHAARDPRLRIISRPNTGIVGALNDGLAAATGEFIARMDGDDIAEPTRFAEQLAYLANHPDCVAVGSEVWLIDPDSAVIDRYAPPLDHSGIEEQLLRGNGGALIHPVLMLRRAAVDAIGGYRREYDRAEDLDLFLRLCRHGQLANLSSPLLRYRIHVGSTNFVHRQQQLALCARLVAQARAERGLPPLPPGGPSAAPPDLSIATRHRGWVITSLRWGRRRTAIKHALLALRAETGAASWKHLRYALTASRPANP